MHQVVGGPASSQPLVSERAAEAVRVDVLNASLLAAPSDHVTYARVGHVSGVVPLDAEPWPRCRRLVMAGAYAHVAIKRSSSFLADRHPGLVTTFEADTKPPLRQEHVVTVLVVQVVAEVREPRDAKAGIDQHAQDGGI